MSNREYSISNNNYKFNRNIIAAIIITIVNLKNLGVMKNWFRNTNKKSNNSNNSKNN